MSTSPSVTTEGEAQVPLSVCAPSCGVSCLTFRSQATRPSLRLNAMTTKRCAALGLTPPLGACDSARGTFQGIAVVMYTLSPQTTGDDEPRPGTSAFQR